MPKAKPTEGKGSNSKKRKISSENQDSKSKKTDVNKASSQDCKKTEQKNTKITKTGSQVPDRIKSMIEGAKEMPFAKGFVRDPDSEEEVTDHLAMTLDQRVQKNKELNKQFLKDNGIYELKQQLKEKRPKPISDNYESDDDDDPSFDPDSHTDSDTDEEVAALREQTVRQQRMMEKSSQSSRGKGNALSEKSTVSSLAKENASVEKSTGSSKGKENTPRKSQSPLKSRQEVAALREQTVRQQRMMEKSSQSSRGKGNALSEKSTVSSLAKENASVEKSTGSSKGKENTPRKSQSPLKSRQQSEVSLPCGSPSCPYKKQMEKIVQRQAIKCGKAGVYEPEAIKDNKMWEILAGTGACIPVPAREMTFNMAASRVDLARRLFRVFYSEEDMALARSLYQLPDSAIILPAIIACAMKFKRDEWGRPKEAQMKKAMHNIVAYALRDKAAMVRANRERKEKRKAETSTTQDN